MPEITVAEIVILVVEDEEKSRERMRQVLEKRGFSVVCARNGIEALLEGGRRPEIRLLIADVTPSPCMDAVEVAKALRRRRPALRVLYIGAGPAALQVRSETKSGKAAFLAKPFAPEELIKGVFDTLELPPPRARAPGSRSRKPKRTILMLVPESDLRLRVARLLRQENYLVLEAGNIGEALCISEWHVGGIGLLLADSGALDRLPAELCERLSQGRPHMRVLRSSSCALPDVPLTERVRLTLQEWGIEALGGV